MCLLLNRGCRRYYTTSQLLPSRVPIPTCHQELIQQKNMQSAYMFLLASFLVAVWTWSEFSVFFSCRFRACWSGDVVITLSRKFSPQKREKSRRCTRCISSKMLATSRTRKNRIKSTSCWWSLFKKTSLQSDGYSDLMWVETKLIPGSANSKLLARWISIGYKARRIVY